MEHDAGTRRHSSSEWYLVAVACLYTVAQTVSVSFQNWLMPKQECLPPVPFGECPFGEYEAQMEVWPDRLRVPQYFLSFVIALLAGAWSDSHGRRRRPLIFVPILGQILSDGLYFVNNFWFWPWPLEMVFTSVIPGLYVGRNMFWIGATSYVSESSTVGSRTLKLGILIGSYAISSLIGSGVVALLKTVTTSRHYYIFFMVPIFFNAIAMLIGYSFIADTSDSYNKNIVWLRPKYLFKGYTGLFKNKLKSFTVALVVLILCQSVLVARTGGEYVYILRYIKYSLSWSDLFYVRFTVIKVMALFFGTLFSVAVLSHKMKINDLVIGIITCCLYIAAALCYVVFVNNQLVQLSMSRLNSIQTSMNSLLTFSIVIVYDYAFDGIYRNELVNLSLTVFLYVVLTLPILYVFVVLHSKCKEFWEKDVYPPKPSVFVISQPA